ncbi:lactonase family protein [Flavobacterium noncentrifugens]|nr:lactonase family protein [Flavobacterium noncentrifugens]
MKKLLSVAALLFFLQNFAQANMDLLVGTYTHSCDSKGIYVYDFNTETAAFKLKNNTDKAISPSYLTVSPDDKFVYSVNESGKESTISSFKFQPKSGRLDLLNKQSSEGADPCYIINADQNVISANYSGGTISIFKKNPDGSLAKAAQVIKHEGSSINKQRQESAHVHMVQFSPDKKFVLANDLGTDRIYLYQYNPASTNEILKFKDTIAIKTGSGPRHLIFSPDGKFIYLLQELDGTITVFDYFNGKLQRIQEATLAQNGFKGQNGGAAIKISNDGKFVYATNRGEANTISLFEVNAKGKLVHKKTISTGGKNPRDFTIVPGGKFVLVAHQDSNDIIIFNRNQATGELTNSGKKIELCSPVNLIFTKAE